MATNYVTKLDDILSFGILAFQNRLEYRKAGGRVNSATSWPTSSNSGDHVVHLCTCVEKNWKNLAYSTRYLRMYFIDLYLIF